MIRPDGASQGGPERILGAASVAIAPGAAQLSLEHCQHLRRTALPVFGTRVLTLEGSASGQSGAMEACRFANCGR